MKMLSLVRVRLLVVATSAFLVAFASAQTPEMPLKRSSS